MAPFFQSISLSMASRRCICALHPCDASGCDSRRSSGLFRACAVVVSVSPEDAEGASAVVSNLRALLVVSFRKGGIQEKAVPFTFNDYSERQQSFLRVDVK
jgi:hypothetical protein